MKKLGSILFVTALCAVTLAVFSACQTSPLSYGTEESRTSESSVQNTAESVLPVPELPETVTLLRQSLPQVFSFRVDEMYMNLAAYGFTQTISQQSGSDGSFHFTDDSHLWNHYSDYDEQTVMEYYYQYEDGTLVCYRRTDGGAPTRYPFSEAEKRDLFASQEQVFGMQTLLPDYLVDFRDEGVQSDTGLRCYTFRLPLSEVLAQTSLLSAYVTRACDCCGYTYQASDDLFVTATLCTDENLRPVTLSYDFEELKPYVLGESGMSGEYALGTDMMYLTIDFDYTVAQTIPVPDDFIPAS